MLNTDLNLATRPFPAYRFINVVLGCALIALVFISGWQVYGFLHFSSMARAIRDDEQNVRVEAESLGKHVTELESILDRPEVAAKLNEIGYLNQLIERRSLSWTRLFAYLEDMVPPNVQLLSLNPSIGSGGAVALRIEVQGRSIADVTELIEALEKSPIFEKVVVSVEQKTDTTTTASDVNVSLMTNYYPQRDVK